MLFTFTVSQEYRCTIGNDNYVEELDLSDLSDSESSHETEMELRNTQCVVCLQRKDATYLFLPCRHAICCRDCSDRLEQ